MEQGCYAMWQLKIQKNKNIDFSENKKCLHMVDHICEGHLIWRLMSHVKKRHGRCCT